MPIFALTQGPLFIFNQQRCFSVPFFCSHIPLDVLIFLPIPLTRTLVTALGPPDSPGSFPHLKGPSVLVRWYGALNSRHCPFSSTPTHCSKGQSSLVQSPDGLCWATEGGRSSHRGWSPSSCMGTAWDWIQAPPPGSQGNHVPAPPSCWDFVCPAPFGRANPAPSQSSANGPHGGWCAHHKTPEFWSPSVGLR